MERLYLVTDAVEIARRRPLVPRGQLVEVWPDLYAPGQFWMGPTSKALLDEVAATPLPSPLQVDGERVPIYYGPGLADLESLPLEESLRSRALSAHGMAVAWITIDEFGERRRYEPQSPRDPIFYLRRPAGTAAHIWRLFRTRAEAQVYMGESYGRDAEAMQWAQALPTGSYEEMIERHAIRD